MAFDAVRERVVLLGGFPVTGSTADTWEWDGAEWTQVADTGPGARALNGSHTTPCASRSSCSVDSDNANLLGDTWAWDGTDWTQIADTGPEARATHAMTFDVAAQRVLLFGGLGAPPAGAALGDTWAWDGAVWTEVAHFGPPAVAAASADCDGHTVLLFGGGIATSSPIVPLGTTWQWNGQHWTERQDMGPQARMAAGLAFDAARSRYVLFGGAGAPPTGSTDYLSSAIRGRPSTRPHPRP